MNHDLHLKSGIFYTKNQPNVLLRTQDLVTKQFSSRIKCAFKQSVKHNLSPQYSKKYLNGYFLV